MRSNVVAWQWSVYPQSHQSRSNLIVHAFTAPAFNLGCVLLLAAPWRPWLALPAALAVGLALTLQGRGHRSESIRPEPFQGPVDFVQRFLCEQWVTFPRFVIGGGFNRAWSLARPRDSPSLAGPPVDHEDLRPG